MKAFLKYLRGLNERLMEWHGWVRAERLHELDARAERLIELYEGQPVTTEEDLGRLAGHMHRIIDANVRIARRRK